ncbi:MAG: hypothetical protein C5B50_21730 [Verrucomicrobia bacterium]|nr:MAG: hypothetical protein C5B50_21730 [Verrucomicrobiota bacterium]
MKPLTLSYPSMLPNAATKMRREACLNQRGPGQRLARLGATAVVRLRLLAALLCIVFGVRSTQAFSIYGPKEGFHTQTLGYIIYLTDLPLPDGSGWLVFTPGDFSSAPHNIGEGFRWNIPDLYYTYDETFLRYFGDSGVQAVDSAVAMLNNLDNVDNYSPSLSEFPFEELRYNYTARDLGMFDVRSAALEVLLERLGLADPQHWVWCMRAKFLLPGLSCPNYDYEVIQRNFDPLTWVPTGYINGNLFTYVVFQVCPPDLLGDFTEAEVASVDQVGGVYATAVATPKIHFPKPLWMGSFHTSLTVDDVGGLRHLYSTNTLAWEAMPANTTLIVTNTTQGRLLTTSNLTLFSQQAAVTNAAGLQALYPGLIISASTNWAITVPEPVYTAIATNSPYDPAGAAPHLVIVTNYVLTPEIRYQHTFANLVTFRVVNGAWTAIPITTLSNYMGHGFGTAVTLVATNGPYDAPGSQPATNIFQHSFLTNEVVGDFAILPTNSCGFQIQYPLLTNVVANSNLVFSLTAGVGITNGGGTNVTLLSSNSFVATALFDYYTNHTFWVYDVNCLVATNAIGLRPGIGKINFHRKDFDSLLGRFFSPITNYYTLTELTNNQFVDRTVFRVVTQPDVNFTAADLAAPFPEIVTVARTAPNFDSTATPPGEVGPGTIEGPVTFAFNKVGPTFINGTYPVFLDEEGAIQDFIWASFDGSANDPITYPVGTSITNLLNQVPMAILPPVLPAASISAGPYSAQLSGTGGQPPYTFSISPGSLDLPAGLTLGTDGSISGTPQNAGVYSFTIRMTDAFFRFVDRTYAFSVTP